MKKTIVIIEDEKEIIESLRYLLEKNQFIVLAYLSAEEFFSAKTRPDHCVYLVDWNLPGIKGIDIIRTIRLKDKISPIFMMSAYNKSDQIIEGLQSGADDYITKPFKTRELLARIRAVLRRGDLRGESDRDVLRRGGLVIDALRHEVMYDGELIVLTATEFRLLRFLAANPGRVFTRDQLLNQVIGEKAVVIDRNIDVHVRSVRRKLGAAHAFLETVRGVGYRFASSVGA
jgi:two-component system phosphate regulon response regulator PhoB